MAVGIIQRGKGFQDARYRDLIAKLIEARRVNGLSQTELATLLGRHQQFVSRYELGERRLDIVEFIDITRALGLEAPQLVSSVPILSSKPLAKIDKS